MAPGSPSRTERRSGSHPIATGGRDRAPDVHGHGSRTGDRRRFPETPVCLPALGRAGFTLSTPDAANRSRPGCRTRQSPPRPAGEGRRQWRPGEPSLRRGPGVLAPCAKRWTKDATRRTASQNRGSRRIRCAFRLLPAHDRSPQDEGLRPVTGQLAGPARPGPHAGPGRVSGSRKPGDVRPVSEGVSELRIGCGPGYRVYFRKRGRMIAVLLADGDKRTKSQDVKTALRRATISRDGNGPSAAPWTGWICGSLLPVLSRPISSTVRISLLPGRGRNVWSECPTPRSCAAESGD